MLKILLLAILTYALSVRAINVSQPRSGSFAKIALSVIVIVSFFTGLGALVGLILSL